MEVLPFPSAINGAVSGLCTQATPVQLPPEHEIPRLRELPPGAEGWISHDALKVCPAGAVYVDMNARFVSMSTAFYDIACLCVSPACFAVAVPHHYYFPRLKSWDVVLAHTLLGAVVEFNTLPAEDLEDLDG